MMSQVISIFMSLIVFACLAGQSAQTLVDVPLCKINKIEWENENMTCPRKAVCAVVFTDAYQKNKPPGGYPSQAMRHYCMCPGEGETTTTCPIDNPAHRLYHDARFRSYTCQPICTLPYCTDLSDNRGSIAQSRIIVDAKNQYTRMECRCPRHHKLEKGEERHSSVRFYSSEHSDCFKGFVYFSTCNFLSPDEKSTKDPCLD